MALTYVYTGRNGVSRLFNNPFWIRNSVVNASISSSLRLALNMWERFMRFASIRWQFTIPGISIIRQYGFKPIKKYKQKGSFLFKPTDRLSTVCNVHQRRTSRHK